MWFITFISIDKKDIMKSDKSFTFAREHFLSTLKIENKILIVKPGVQNKTEGLQTTIWNTDNLVMSVDEIVRYDTPYELEFRFKLELKDKYGYTRDGIYVWHGVSKKYANNELHAIIDKAFIEFRKFIDKNFNMLDNDEGYDEETLKALYG